MAKKKRTRKDDTGGQIDAIDDVGVDFETALADVEQIVADLEGGQLGLADCLRRYERGIEKLKRCHELLDAAEQKVSVLSGFDADGNPMTQPLASMRPRDATANAKPEDADGDDSSDGLF